MKNNDQKLTGQALQILGVRVNSTEPVEVLSLVSSKISHKNSFFIVTPNPEFIVACQKDDEFRKILNQADLAIPDGIGLILASKFLRTRPQLKERITGADLVEKVLELGEKEGWEIGIVGARRGEIEEIKEMMNRLKQRYPKLKVEALELVADWPKREYQMILAAQGMINQEKWIWQNYKKVKGVGFLGIGGSLDRLTGITPRAPKMIRRLGLEWFWRLILNPSHFKRVWNACVIFPWLVLKEKMKRS